MHTSISHHSRAIFVLTLLVAAMAAQAQDYYVNDSSTTHDAWCTAPGDDANDGLTPATPKATVQAIIDGYDLEPGDIVHIDTGTYTLSSTIEITEDDEGAFSAPVTFQASPYGVAIDGAGGDIWYLNDCNYVTLTTATSTTHAGLPQRWMRITGGRYGVHTYHADHCVLKRIEIASCSSSGVRARVAWGFRLEHSIIHHCEDGVYLTPYFPYTWEVENNTIVLNRGRQLYVNDTEPYGFYPPTIVRNNIFWADGALSTTIAIAEYGVASDHNCVHATNGAGSGLASWRMTNNEDLHSIDAPPLFVDADNGDYHLQSTAGSYGGGAWTADAASSLCIDTGIGDAGDEPLPNTTPHHAPDKGQRNLGAYGGTEQASKTPAGRMLVLQEPVGGETYPNQSIPVSVRWTWVGTDWQTDDTLSLHRSADSATTWLPIQGTASLRVYDGTYSWNIQNVAPGVHHRVKAEYTQDSTVLSQSTEDFRVGVTRVFYVNDEDTTDDFWCTAPGGINNDGLTPATPTTSLYTILRYDLNPGDTVRIDTGSHPAPVYSIVNGYHQGSSAAPVTFIGSPNGTTVGDAGKDQVAWTMRACQHIHLRRMKLATTDMSVSLKGARHCVLDQLVIERSTWNGVIAQYCESILVRNCVVTGQYSDDPYPNSALKFNNCVDTILANNSISVASITAVEINDGDATLTNNIISASGWDGRCIAGNGSTIASDYNDLYATSFAGIATVDETTYSTLAHWQAATGQDAHSISADPLFVDADNGDFRLTAGSPCIDAANGNLAPETDHLDHPRYDDPGTEPNTGVGTPDFADIGAFEFMADALPAPPSALDVDMQVMDGAALSLNAPGCNSLQMLSIDPGANPADTPIAIQIGDDPASGWLRFEPAGARGFDVFPDGTVPEPHTAAEWAGLRLRGLEPDTEHIFYARTFAGGIPSDLTRVGTYATSPYCDVNRSLGMRPVRGSDFARVRQAVLEGGDVGQSQSWACEADGDGFVTIGDLLTVQHALMNP